MFRFENGLLGYRVSEKPKVDEVLVVLGAQTRQGRSGMLGDCVLACEIGQPRARPFAVVFED